MLKIFLDIDGVVRNWDSGVCQLFGLGDVLVRSWDTIENLALERGVVKTGKEFWEKQTSDFWAGLKMYQHAHDFLSMLEDLVGKKNICLLTAPTLTSAGGTQKWIRKNMPYFFNSKQYLIGPAKHFVAGAGKLLIDDKDDNVIKFREAGGEAIVFPQPWNSMSKLHRNGWKYVIEELRRFSLDIKRQCKRDY